MTAAVPPVRVTAPDPPMQQLLMRFTGALNRRRAYASTHPMVLAAEDQLHESISGALAARPVLTIAVAKTELLIDGEPYVTRSSYARELATRLHRRGVGAITIQVGVPQLQLRETLAWLATDPTTDDEIANDRAPALSGIAVTRVAYDQLALGDAERAAEHSAAHLWRSLAQIARSDGEAGDEDLPRTGANDDVDPDRVLALVRAAADSPEIARRAALALMELASHGGIASPAGCARIGEHLQHALDTIGHAVFPAIICALGDQAAQHRFVSQMVDVLPIGAIGTWLQVAATAQQQTVSPPMLQLLARLGTLAAERNAAASDAVVRSAAQSIVQGWLWRDASVDHHLAALDRIALHERSQGGTQRVSAAHSTVTESSRLVQMALEIDLAGDDAAAAAATLVLNGAGSDVLRWTDEAGDTECASRLRSVATSEAAIHQLLLTEPVDRLQARALLERLAMSSAPTLIDVLERAEARGTRMIVRQRLSEFGAGIAPILIARLDQAPWYLVRNILTLLHEIAGAQTGSTAGMESLARLLDHPQVQVRTEAFRLLMFDVRAREAAIRRALRDDNERIVVLALQALTESQDAPTTLSPPIISQLMELVDSGRPSDTVRARMVRALALTTSDRVRDWLIALVVRKSRVLRRTTLAEPTLTAVAATQVLARVYSSDPVASPIIALARKEGVDRRWQPRESIGNAEPST
jgi:hypothetical protein